MERTDWRTYDYSERPTRSMANMRLRTLGDSLHPVALSSSYERHASAPPTRTLSKSPTRPTSAAGLSYLSPTIPKTPTLPPTQSPREAVVPSPSDQKPHVSDFFDPFRLVSSNAPWDSDYDGPSLTGNPDSRDADNDEWNDPTSRNRSQQRTIQPRDPAMTRSRKAGVGFDNYSSNSTPLRGRNQSSGRSLRYRESSNTSTVHTSNQRSNDLETIAPRIVTPTQAELAHDRIDLNHRGIVSIDMQDDLSRGSATLTAHKPSLSSMSPKTKLALPAFEDEDPFDVCSNGSQFPARRKNRPFRHGSDEPFDEIETDEEITNPNAVQTPNRHDEFLTPSSTIHDTSLLLPSLAAPPSPRAISPSKCSLEQKHQPSASEFQSTDHEEPLCEELTSLPSSPKVRVFDQLKPQPNPQRMYISDDESDSDIHISRSRSLPPRLHSTNPFEAEDASDATHHHTSLQSSFLNAASHSSETDGAALSAPPYDATSPSVPFDVTSPASPYDATSPASPYDAASPASLFGATSPAFPFEATSPAFPHDATSPGPPCNNALPASPSNGVSHSSVTINYRNSTHRRGSSQSSFVDAASHSSEVVGAASPVSPFDAALHASITNNYNNSTPRRASSHSLVSDAASHSSEVVGAASPASPYDAELHALINNNYNNNTLRRGSSQSSFVDAASHSSGMAGAASPAPHDAELHASTTNNYSNAIRHRASSQSSVSDAASHMSEATGVVSPASLYVPSSLASPYDAASHALITNSYKKEIFPHDSAFGSSSFFDSTPKSTNPFDPLSPFTGDSSSGPLYGKAQSLNTIENNVDMRTYEPKRTVSKPLVTTSLPPSLDELHSAQPNVERVLSNETLSTMEKSTTSSCADLNPYVNAENEDNNNISGNRIWSKSAQNTAGIRHEADIPHDSINTTRQERADEAENDLLRWKQAEEEWKRAEAAQLEYTADDDNCIAEEEIISVGDSHIVPPVSFDAVETGARADRYWNNSNENKGLCHEQEPLSLVKQNVAITPAVNVSEDASISTSSFMRSNDSSASKTKDLLRHGPTSILRAGRYDGSGTVSDSGVSRHSHPWDKVGTSRSKSDNEESLDSVFDFSDVDEQKEEIVVQSVAVSPKQIVVSKKKGEATIDKSKSQRGLNPEHEKELDESSIESSTKRTSKKEKRNNLQTRSKQAWSARSKSTSSASRNSSFEDHSGAKRVSKPADKEKDRVTFVAFAEDEKNTVHEFVPHSKKELQDDDTMEYTEFTDDGTNYSEDNTIGSRSLNSAYTKSNESEVEDIIKDFLFIGRGEVNTPGKRRMKYKKGHRNRTDTHIPSKKSTTVSKKTSSGVKRSSVRRGRALSRDFEDTYAEERALEDKSKSLRKGDKKDRGKCDEDSVYSSAVSSAADVEPDSEPDPLALVWDYVEDGFTAMSSALGLSSKNLKKNSESKRQVENRLDPPERMAKHPLSPNKKSEGAKVQVTSPVRLRRGDNGKSEFRTLETDHNLNDEKPPLHSWLEYASNLLFAREPKEDSSFASIDDEDTIDGTIDGIFDDTHEGTFDLKSVGNENYPNKNVGLLKLALSATRNKHTAHGVTFDESIKIDILNDIKHIVLTIALPLGLIFQENAAGCWVTKVLEYGNAACSKAPLGERVEVGDQLAAVNGINAVCKKGSEVGKMISNAANLLKIELVFVRYIGPLRPSKNTLEQEGYEVSNSIEELDPIVPPDSVALQTSFSGIESERLKKFKKTKCWQKADIASLSSEPAFFKNSAKTPVSSVPSGLSAMTKAGSFTQALPTTMLPVEPAQKMPSPVISPPLQAEQQNVVHMTTPPVQAEQQKAVHMATPPVQAKQQKAEHMASPSVHEKQQKVKSVAPPPGKVKPTAPPPAQTKQQKGTSLMQTPNRAAAKMSPPISHTTASSLLIKPPEKYVGHQPENVEARTTKKKPPEKYVGDKPATAEARTTKKKFGFFKIGKKKNQR